MMKRFVTFFRNLPPEMRMLLAMAGLGTPAGLIYLLSRYMGLSPMKIVAVLLILVVGLVLIAFVVSKLFSRGAGKRRREMESRLGGMDSGPVSMDVRAAIKSNNERFFNAIREMRKNVGINVYDLPWYIVIGDSGCGKTKLINEGGLVFSTGKPEGYQLGTLNYNWWFTEEAVFVDMAGRLCNPQDDADRKEWTAFLETIAKGRRGFPINGAILCVSAEHLLQDSPEKLEQDANTALERLRDLQGKLGVTFATYLVITKCDKVLGFMQFFDRAGRDITVKNQIFGWSKPGTFSELYDPEQFGQDFDALYGRLNELRLRRLNDDVDEIELGLAYSFPEEFREFREPLHTYLRTLFPMIKNPRAVKNLIFRGLYFTSATQIGGVILKRLTERLGNEVADQFAPLENLFPQPRPHFVKDLLARKVIPEQGLVFRNEGQVIRNRKLSRLLKVGSVAMATILIGALTWSALTFGGMIATPREEARVAADKVPVPAKALESANIASAAVQNLIDHPLAAHVLSVGFGADRPKVDLRKIQLSMFEYGLLAPMLREIDNQLRSAELPSPLLGKDAVKAADEYMTALHQYVLWFALAGETEPAVDLTLHGLTQMCAIVPDAKFPSGVRRADFMAQAADYFTAIGAKSGEWKRNPARFMLDAKLPAHLKLEPEATIARAVTQVHTYLAAFAVLSDKHPDPAIREWMRVCVCCAKVEDSYRDMLSLPMDRIASEDDLKEFRDKFVGYNDQFHQALAGCVWQGDRGPSQFLRIPSLSQAILQQRQRWTGYQAKLLDAYGKGTPPADSPILKVLGWLTEGDQQSAVVRGLDRVCYDSLKETALTEQRYMSEFFGNNFASFIKEVHVQYDQVIGLSTADKEPRDDVLAPTKDAETVDAVLGKIGQRLKDAKFGVEGDSGQESLANWKKQLAEHVELCQKPRESDQPGSLGTLKPKWKPDQLQAFVGQYENLITRGEGTVLLKRIMARLQQTDAWGVAELEPTWRDKQQSAYEMTIPLESQAPAAASTETVPAQQPPKIGLTPPAFGRRTTEPVVQAPRPTAIKLAGMIPNCATHDFLNARAEDCVQLLYYLEYFPDNCYLRPSDGQGQLAQASRQTLLTAWNRYAETYVKAWADAYQQKQLILLKRLIAERAGSWGSLSAALSDKRSPGDSDPREIGIELQSALEEILRAIPWATYNAEAGWWKNLEYRGWTDLAAGVESAIKANWPTQYAGFVGEVKSVGGDSAVSAATPPWTRVAQEAARNWTNCVDGMVRNIKLPRQFDENLKLAAQVPWDATQKLCQDCRLQNEKLLVQYVLFFKQAQALLSAELTDICFDIQQASFPNLSPYDGWPFINAQGTDLNALDTVPFDNFRNFLMQIEQAERVFAPLEDGLPDDDPLKIDRLKLYKACRQWREFMQFEKGAPAPLRVEVQYRDPLNSNTPCGLVPDIDDTAQQYYGEVQLSIGLNIIEGDRVVEGGVLKIPTKTLGQAGVRRSQWAWVGNKDVRFKMQLAEGIQGIGQPEAYPNNIDPVLLGSSSPLAFPAYLHRYARFCEEAGVWASWHSVDLKQAFQKAGKANLVPTNNKFRMGAKFTFKLDRPMPVPIEACKPSDSTKPALQAGDVLGGR